MIENSLGTLSEEDFKTRFESFMSIVEGLPTLPSILWEVQATLKNRNSGSEEIAYVIEQDLSLTGNILRLANSAYFGSGERFISVVDAVTRIGQREIERMVSSTLIVDTFSEMGQSMDYTEFWCHNIQVAEIVSLIADLNPDRTSMLTSEIYMVGLLHDVGKLLLDQYFAEEFILSRKYAEDHKISEVEAELTILGMEHGEMGACLMEYWGMSSQMVETIRYNHRTEKCPEEFRADAELISFSNVLSNAHCEGVLNEEIMQHPTLNLGEMDMKSLIKLLDTAKERGLTLVT